MEREVDTYVLGTVHLSSNICRSKRNSPRDSPSAIVFILFLFLHDIFIYFLFRHTKPRHAYLKQAFSSSLTTSYPIPSIEAVVHLGTENLLDGFFFLVILASFLSLTLLTWAFSRGGIAWKNGRNQMGRVSIPGPRGLPPCGSLFSLSHGLRHLTLACMASSHAATKLTAFSLGSTPAVITSDLNIAKEILTSSHFANRPIKKSAKCLIFSCAIGFAPNGSYWRLLRKIASVNLFTPKRISAQEDGRQFDCAMMLRSIHNEQTLCGVVGLRKHLQAAALNNIMSKEFGKRYDGACNNAEARELHEIVREGFELLGAFNWSDYLPWLSSFYDPFRIKNRCASLLFLELEKWLWKLLRSTDFINLKGFVITPILYTWWPSYGFVYIFQSSVSAF